MCGGVGFAGTSVVLLIDEQVHERHTGPCQWCGQPREFLFRVPNDHEVRLDPADFGGPQPSELLDPGEWMAVAEMAASRPGGSAPEDFALAAAAVEEALKFLPPDSDEIPARAFHSRVGREAYARMPERYTRGRLGAIAAAFRDRAKPVTRDDATT
jgi:hypothetical protein